MTLQRVAGQHGTAKMPGFLCTLLLALASPVEALADLGTDVAQTEGLGQGSLVTLVVGSWRLHAQRT